MTGGYCSPTTFNLTLVTPETLSSRSVKLLRTRGQSNSKSDRNGVHGEGNLTGVMSGNACADDLCAYATAVMAPVQNLDSEVIYMNKTEERRKLHVHGVAIDRHMAEGRLELARREIELMTGEKLPYAPRWIKVDTLGERFESRTIEGKATRARRNGRETRAYKNSRIRFDEYPQVRNNYHCHIRRAKRLA
jgi:hypothetical protein